MKIRDIVMLNALYDFCMAFRGFENGIRNFCQNAYPRFSAQEIIIYLSERGWTDEYDSNRIRYIMDNIVRQAHTPVETATESVNEK